MLRLRSMIPLLAFALAAGCGLAPTGAPAPTGSRAQAAGGGLPALACGSANRASTIPSTFLPRGGWAASATSTDLRSALIQILGQYIAQTFTCQREACPATSPPEACAQEVSFDNAAGIPIHPGFYGAGRDEWVWTPDPAFSQGTLRVVIHSFPPGISYTYGCDAC